MKLYTTIVFLLMLGCSGIAKADSYANAMKVECAPELSSLIISFQNYFGKTERDFAIKNSQSLAEKHGIYILEGLLSPGAQPYRFECTLNGNKLQLTVDVAYKKAVRNNYCANDLSVQMTLRNDGKPILNKVSSLQCSEAQNIDKIILNYGSGAENSSMRVAYISYGEANGKNKNDYGYKDFLGINKKPLSLDSREFWARVNE